MSDVMTDIPKRGGLRWLMSNPGRFDDFIQSLARTSLMMENLSVTATVNGVATRYAAKTSDRNAVIPIAVDTPIADGSITNAMLAGGIDLTTKVTGTLPFANGGAAGTAATSATSGTMTVSMTTAVITITETGSCTFNASGGATGRLSTFAITSSGGLSVMTFGTNFRSTGTLNTGAAAGRLFCVTFRCLDGTSWAEICRTAAMV